MLVRVMRASAIIVSTAMKVTCTATTAHTRHFRRAALRCSSSLNGIAKRLMVATQTHVYTTTKGQGQVHGILGCGIKATAPWDVAPESGVRSSRVMPSKARKHAGARLP